MAHWKKSEGERGGGKPLVQGCLKCPWHEIFYYLVRKSFQNDEEWRLFYCNSILGCWVIQDFDLCKLDKCDVTKGTQSGAKLQKIEYLCKY